MSIKKLQREIMLSAVYQLSAEDDKAASAKDSGDRLYWHATRKRMDAEEIHDAVLDVAGDLDDTIGGPSKDLTPDYHRRALYGKVSRYKIDSYLQLFDFPPPNISAEKRFTTTVPLQRLFLMNSDFMQIEAEDLYKRVAAEPDNRARIKKLYNIVYGREPKESEVQLGLSFLKTEPLKEYEEDKNKPKEGPGQRGGRGGPKADAKPEAKPDSAAAEAKTDAAKVEPAKTMEAESKSGEAKTEVAAKETPAADAAKAASKADSAPDKESAGEGDSSAPEEVASTDDMPADPNAGMGMGMMGGMMGGVNGRRGGPAKPAEVKYEPTVWGRYAKLLLSSTEFIFIN
jgi:hypothetical protein